MNKTVMAIVAWTLYGLFGAITIALPFISSPLVKGCPVSIFSLKIWLYVYGSMQVGFYLCLFPIALDFYYYYCSTEQKGLSKRIYFQICNIATVILAIAVVFWACFGIYLQQSFCPQLEINTIVLVCSVLGLIVNGLGGIMLLAMSIIDLCCYE